jgi:VWFA-related protein
MSRRPLAIVGALWLVAVNTPAARQGGQTKDAPKFTSQTAAILVDVVVRDKKGAPVLGLTAADFDVFEDGVRQKLISLDAVSAVTPSLNALNALNAPNAPNAPVAPERPPTSGQTVVALVFDWLSEESRLAAWKAARSLLDDMKPGDYAGVFAIDHSLRRIVPFTNNTAALNEGFTLALEHPKPGTSRMAGAMVNALAPRPETSPTAGAEESGTPTTSTPAPPATGADAGTGNADAAFAAMLAALDAGQHYIDKEVQANAGTDSLRGLVRLLAPLAGRKTVVLFSEGLSITNGSIDRWHRLQNEANRHNVAFYTFDAMGLRVQSQQAAMGRGIGSQFGDGYARGQYNDTSESRLELLLGGPTHGLAELANSSSNPALDNSYRSIGVKVRRPGVTVRARPGYVAATSVGILTSRDYEAPALAAFSVHPQPMAFPFRLQGLSTPMPGQPGVVSLIVVVDTSLLTFTEDSASARYSGQATILTRVRSKNGDIIFSRSEHYELTGNVAQLAKIRAGQILFFTAPDLPPGSHTVEWVVRDDEGGRASVARSALEVPQGARPIVGDLILVSRSEPAPKGKAVATNPLAWKGQLLYPSFGDPISRTRQPNLSFAIPMVLPTRGPAPTAILRLLARNRLIVESPLALGAAGKDGRLIALGHLPIGSLPPGSYDLQVTVSEGDQREIRSAEFSVIR